MREGDTWNGNGRAKGKITRYRVEYSGKRGERPYLTFFAGSAGAQFESLDEAKRYVDGKAGERLLWDGRKLPRRNRAVELPELSEPELSAEVWEASGFWTHPDLVLRGRRERCPSCRKKIIEVPGEGHPLSHRWELENDRDGYRIYCCPDGCAADGSTPRKIPTPTPMLPKEFKPRVKRRQVETFAVGHGTDQFTCQICSRVEPLREKEHWVTCECCSQGDDELNCPGCGWNALDDQVEAPHLTHNYECPHCETKWGCN